MNQNTITERSNGITIDDLKKENRNIKNLTTRFNLSDSLFYDEAFILTRYFTEVTIKLLLILSIVDDQSYFYVVSTSLSIEELL